MIGNEVLVLSRWEDEKVSLGEAESQGGRAHWRPVSRKTPTEKRAR